jgi:hypothetical protein
MSVQQEALNSTVPFIRYANPGAVKSDATIKQDAARTAVLYKLTVMGKQTSAVPTTGTANAGNTGNGTVTAVAKLSDGKPAIIGAYNLECIAAVANGGTFKLVDPYGNLIANNLVMTAGAGVATIFEAGGIKFTITDAGTDFIVGDKFAITITSVAKYIPLTGVGVNGEAVVAGIYLGDDILAATLVAGDVTSSVMLVADAYFDKNQLILENSLTLASVMPSGKTVEQELAALGLLSEDTIDISHQE